MVWAKGKPSRNIVNNEVWERSALFLPKLRRRRFLVPSRAPSGLHFGDILEVWGTLLGPRGDIGEVLGGSENEVEKRDPPLEFG